MKQDCIMSSWLFNVYNNAVMKEVKMGMEKMGVRFLEDGYQASKENGPG